MIFVPGKENLQVKQFQCKDKIFAHRDRELEPPCRNWWCPWGWWWGCSRRPRPSSHPSCPPPRPWSQIDAKNLEQRKHYQDLKHVTLFLANNYKPSQCQDFVYWRKYLQICIMRKSNSKLYRRFNLKTFKIFRQDTGYIYNFIQFITSRFQRNGS